MPRLARRFAPHMLIGVPVALAVLAATVGWPRRVPVVMRAPPGAEAAALRWAARVQAGDCQQAGDLVAPLTDLTIPRGPVHGQGARAIPAAASFTSVPLPLDQLLATNVMITVQQTAAPGRPVIACGAIGGVIDLDGTLTIGLRDQHRSGFAGIAELTSTADASGTDVAVFLSRISTKGEAELTPDSR